MIVTFYSQHRGVTHTATLARVVTRLAGWGYSVLCVDWDLAGSTLRSRLGLDTRPWPARGLQELLLDKCGERPPWAADYIRRARLRGAGEFDLLAAGNATMARSGRLDWNILYRDRGLAAYLDRRFDEWRRGYDLVLINGGHGADPSRGIYLAHLPDAVVIAFPVADAPAAVETLRRVEEARDRLPFGRGRLVAVPLPVGEPDAGLHQLLDPWLHAWTARGLRTGDVLAALLTRRDHDPRSADLIAALLARRFTGTALIAAGVDSYIASAARTEQSHPAANRYVVRPGHDLPDALHRVLGADATLTVHRAAHGLTVVLRDLDPFSPVPIGVSARLDDPRPAPFAEIGTSFFAELACSGDLPEHLYLDLGPTTPAEPDATGIVEAARAVRPYLPDLVGKEAALFDRELARLLSELPASVPELRALLTADDLVALWVDELRYDPLHRPPDVQPVRSSDRQATRYGCPVDGNYVRYRRAGEPVPNCPDHGTPLVPARLDD